MSREIELAMLDLCWALQGLQYLLCDQADCDAGLNTEYQTLAKLKLNDMLKAEELASKLIEPVRSKLFHDGGLVTHGDEEQSSYCEIAIAIANSVQLAMSLYPTEPGERSLHDRRKNNAEKKLARTDPFLLSKLVSHEIRSKLPLDDEAPSASLWHTFADDKPIEYGVGPLIGTKTDLAKWTGRGKYPRDLDSPLQHRLFWGRELARNRCELWFKSQDVFAKANARQLSDERLTSAEKR